MNDSDAASKLTLAPPVAGPVDALFVEVYDRLKAMASRRRGPGDTLDTTALVHELYLRVGERPELAEIEQARFFGYAARAMRNLLIDRARNRIGRSGSGWIATTLADDDRRLALESADDALALESALGKLEQVDARAAQVVELRYFAGLSLEQVAQMLDLARRTVDRDWEFCTCLPARRTWVTRMAQFAALRRLRLRTY